MQTLRNQLLALLAAGPSSFAALYGALVRRFGYSSGFDLGALMSALRDLGGHGWVRAWQMAGDGTFHDATEDELKSDLLAYERWLPNAKSKDLAVDEVGLWYEITSSGRAELASCGIQEEQLGHDRWVLDDLRDVQTLVIRAESVKRADDVLHRWLACHPEIHLVETSRRVESVPSFKLRDGSMVLNGIRLVYQYHLTAS